jgi:hypothetical protein
MFLDYGAFPDIGAAGCPKICNVLNKGFSQGFRGESNMREHSPRSFLGIVPALAAALYGDAG